MSLFMRKPAYTTEEIQTQVNVLERLHKLRDMCMQKQMVASDDNKEYWRTEVVRYYRNIESGQRYLQHMLERNAK